MFESDVTFVIGAGASFEAGFPLGQELANDIRNSVSFKFDYGRLVGGNPEIANAIRFLADTTKSTSYWDKCAEISRRLEYCLSIDEFIHRFQHDTDLAIISKIAIAQRIIDAEQQSPMLQRSERHPPKFQPLTDTWYFQFFRMISRGRSKSDIGNIFDNINIICFNYDRCIELYLLNALIEAYGITTNVASGLINSLNIIHPYGTLGTLPELGGRGISFGAEYCDLGAVSREIKTYSEALRDDDLELRIKNAIYRSGSIVFLGFSFGNDNIKLLSPTSDGLLSGKNIFGTCYKMPEPALSVIERSIMNNFYLNSNSSFHIKPMTCASYLNEYNDVIPYE